jgi:hypothetical protein
MLYGSKRPFRVNRRGQKLGDVSGQKFVLTNLTACEISRATGAEFVHCSLRDARITSSDIRDFLGVTLTLDCQTFEGLEFTEPVFDALLNLLAMTRGNDAKRAGLRALIDPKRLAVFDRIFPDLE